MRITHVIVLLTCLLTNLVLADTNLSLPTPTKTAHFLPVPAAPTVDAAAYVVVDAYSGRILASKNENERRAPASLTKMMTLYIVSEALASGRIRLDDEITVSRHAWSMGGSKMFLKAKQKVQVKELIRGIIVASGNDACVAIAEYIAGSEESFVNLMNQEAKRLGMQNTHFTDCTGMPHKEHYTTAADLAILARALVNHFPQYYDKWYAEKWYSFNHIKQPNRNRLLWRTNYVDGIKTGHTEEAGYCLVASGVQNHMRLISVVLGSTTDLARTRASQALLTYGFRFYETHKLYSAGSRLSEPRVWLGARKTVAIGPAHDIYLTTPTGQYQALRAQISLDNELRAPIRKGQVLGHIKIALDKRVLTERPLLALENVEEGGFFTRIKDHVSLSFRHLLHLDDNAEQA